MTARLFVGGPYAGRIVEVPDPVPPVLEVEFPPVEVLEAGSPAPDLQRPPRAHYVPAELRLFGRGLIVLAEAGLEGHARDTAIAECVLVPAALGLWSDAPVVASGPRRADAPDRLDGDRPG